MPDAISGPTPPFGIPEQGWGGGKRPAINNINSYVVYELNSGEKTQEPYFINPNKFGLKNMSGNVLEFCSD